MATDDYTYRSVIHERMHFTIIDTAYEAKTDETKRIFRLLYVADGIKPYVVPT